MKFLQNYFSLLLLSIVLTTLVLTTYGDNGIGRLSKLRREKMEIEAKIAQVEAENELIRREINALKSDDFFVERIAREKLGMVREDEIVFFVPE